MYELRDYQVRAKGETYALIRQGHKKILIWKPTGTGKGLLMSSFAFDVVSKGKRVITVMRRRELIFQTKENYEKYHAHFCSVIMGNEKGYKHLHFNQVCSIDTIRTRMDLEKYAYLKEFDVIIIDECHDTNSPTYQKLFAWLGDKIYLGFTATPFTIGNKPLLFWEKVVQPITAAEARDQGFLVPDITYLPQEQINTEGCKVVAGEFTESDIFDRAKESVIIGDIVKHWIEHGENRPTLLFCINKDHSMLMTAAFTMAGINCMHVDERTTSSERAVAITRLKAGEIKILSSIGILTTGVDIPQASCIIMARPTYSEVVFVQSIGRGLRPYKVCADCGKEYGGDKQCIRCKSVLTSFAKENCLVFDHSGNVLRHGLPFDERRAKLAGPEYEAKKTKDGEKPMLRISTCEVCFIVYAPTLPCCPVCKTQSTGTKNVIKEKDGKLQMVDEDAVRLMQLGKCKATLNELKIKERFYNWKSNAKYFKLHTTCGDIIFKFEKELELPSWLKAIILKEQASSTYGK